MKLLDALAKLGILRFGTKAAVYKTGTERPAELQMDGVFNAERDLVTKHDVDKVVGAGKPKQGNRT